MLPRMIVAIGALLAGVGVALGAFGAHGLPSFLERLGRTENAAKRLEWFETAARYHLIHAVAMVAIGALAVADPTRRYNGAFWAFVVGVTLFSGSLYAMTVGPDAWRKLGMVTPLGGLALIVGWVLLAWRAWR